jgi:hypothetical protein
MDDSKQHELLGELRTLCSKYGITDAIFGGTNGEMFIGYFGVDNPPQSMNTLVNVISNSARLYQAGREKVLKQFDKMAGKY